MGKQYCSIAPAFVVLSSGADSSSCYASGRIPCRKKEGVSRGKIWALHLCQALIELQVMLLHSRVRSSSMVSGH